MAYCCDFTIAADNAIFGQAGPRVSSPADGFFVPFLTKVVGDKSAREMWMLCRRYPALEALEMGLVNRVVPLDRLEAEVDAVVRRAPAREPRLPRGAEGRLRPGDGRLRRARRDLEPALPRLVRHAGGQGGRCRLRRQAEAALLDTPRARAAARQALIDEYEKDKG